MYKYNVSMMFERHSLKSGRVFCNVIFSNVITTQDMKPQCVLISSLTSQPSNTDFEIANCVRKAQLIKRVSAEYFV